VQQFVRALDRGTSLRRELCCDPDARSDNRHRPGARSRQNVMYTDMIRIVCPGLAS
jgi:hypothetical protein